MCGRCGRRVRSARGVVGDSYGHLAGAGVELVLGDLGGHAGSGECLGGTAALYYKGRGATAIVGLERGQDLSGAARKFWLFYEIVLNFQNNTPAFCEAGL